MKAYQSIKNELLRDISNNRQFLHAKVEAMTRKIMEHHDKYDGRVPAEVGKAKNYLSKLIKGYQARQHQDEACLKHIKTKVKHAHLIQ